jgi:hypothetical protein
MHARERIDTSGLSHSLTWDLGMTHAGFGLTHLLSYSTQTPPVALRRSRTLPSAGPGGPASPLLRAAVAPPFPAALACVCLPLCAAASEAGPHLIGVLVFFLRPLGRGTSITPWGVAPPPVLLHIFCRHGKVGKTTDFPCIFIRQTLIKGQKSHAGCIYGRTAGPCHC